MATPLVKGEEQFGPLLGSTLQGIHLGISQVPSLTTGPSDLFLAFFLLFPLKFHRNFDFVIACIQYLPSIEMLLI